MGALLGMLRIGRLSAPEARALSDILEDDADEPALAVSLNEIDEAAGEWDVVAYYPDQDAARRAERRLAHPTAIVSLVPDVDWVRRSLQGLAPVEAGRFFIHGTHDRLRRRAGGISLEIDAGTAFGTGHHATTLGCLTALDHLLKSELPRRILDVGCGTGVLALAAAKALHVEVLASDIDAEAVRVAALNAERNGAGPLIRAIAAPGVSDRRIVAGAPYDLIFANILAGPLIALATPLSRILAPGGRAILSGLTSDQERAVAAAYRQQGLLREKRIQDGNWVTLTLRRPKEKRPAV
jgi:ribosomal protein L11 methyltransferase